ncbi:MAG: ATP-binding protein [Bacteroidales bacterium]|nr:ATP-binding protein [Lachnoclostridium sp.]MCM1385092.1 ATP-binding protein [Lachnoclostridium sp.]MCM1466059.1 ATP-binding protein [Bacteroidales bacterium]
MNELAIVLVWSFFLIIFMACVYVSYFMIKKKELQMRIQIMNTQNDMLERNYEQINEFYTANAKLYHDMNHHLDAVYRMLEKDDKEQAKQYIESLREPMELFSIPLRTGIDMADVILCEMEKRAAVVGISVHMDVQRLPQDIAMKKKDLCALLTNLLDNAVEGAEKEIWVQIKPIHRMLMIQIKNDCIKIPPKENGRLKTTKKTPALHGWGMQIIEQIVSKYEGSMEYHMEKGVFTVEIMMDVLG